MLRTYSSGAALDVRHQELALGLMRREADAGRGVVIADGAPREVLTSVDLGAVFGVPIEVVFDAQDRTVVRPARTPVGRSDG